MLAAAIAVLPLVLLPSLAWGAAGRLRAVDYPAGWAALRRTVAMDRTPGDVVVLPWAAYRSYPWNHGRRVLDPLPRFLDRRVIVNDAVQVGGTAVAAEDPRARRIDAILRAPGPVTAPLRAAGVRYVVLDAETAPGGPLRDRLEGAELVLDRPDVVAYRLADPAPARERATPAWAVWCAWTLTLLTLVISAIMWSIRVSPTTLVTLTPRRKIKTWKGP